MAESNHLNIHIRDVKIRFDCRNWIWLWNDWVWYLKMHENQPLQHMPHLHFRFFLWAIFDAHQLGNFSRSNLWWTSSPTSEFFFGRSLTDIGWEIFRGAIFEGLLRQLLNSSWGNLRRTSVGKFFAERSSMDFFANFRIFLWTIFDAHQLGKFSRSDLRWTSSPTSEFFFGRSLTVIGWEIFSRKRSSMDFLANFRIFLWAIFDGRLVGRYFLRWANLEHQGEQCARASFSFHH